MLKSLFLGLLGIFLAAAPAYANGISISPILLTVSETGGPASLKVGSSRDSKVLIQVRIFNWNQEDGADVMTEATDIRYAPEILELDPGEEKTIRIRVPDTDGDGIWRIVLDELPSTDQVDSTFSEQNAGMNMRVRYVVSMFASEASNGDGLVFNMTGSEETIKLAITNNGTAYARLYGVELENAAQAANTLLPKSGEAEVEPAEQASSNTALRPQLIYVLPGATISADVLKAPVAPDTVSYNIGEDRLTAPLK